MRRSCDLTRRPCRSVQRTGTALIVAIVALVLVTAICFSLVRITLSAAEQAERQHWRRQSMWLADSALNQAAARLRIDAEFTGEVWELAVPGETGEVPGRIVVKVAPAPENPHERTITATAEFPLHATDRVRTTRTLTLALVPAPPTSPGTPGEPEDDDR